MRVALIGYGKMGHELEKVLIERGHTVDMIFDINNGSQICSQNLQNIDIAIEFSTAESAQVNITSCLKNGVPVVSGTTGWLENFSIVENIAKQSNTAFFYASNFSIGVNIFQQINYRLAELMNGFSGYDVTLEEVHHTQKKDAPSGTAITLANDIVACVDRKNKWHLGTTTAPEEVEISSIRRSVVPGIHSVTWESDVDSITITHSAKSRKGFATGAVLAAEFLIGKKGVYSMKDLLKL